VSQRSACITPFCAGASVIRLRGASAEITSTSTSSPME
jgi:hypothetical protein